jgi:hypothetical protein
MESRRNFKDEAVVSASESKFGAPPGLRQGTLALAIAVLGQFVYRLVTVRLY